MIKPGITAKVIAGAMHPSLNFGKIVTVSSYQGEHTLHGPIWRCTGTNLISEYGIVGIAMDFAEDWLEPVNPDNPVESSINALELKVA